MKATIKRIAIIMMTLMLIGNVLAPMNVYAADNSTVYVTRTGKCYHSSTCPTIQGRKVTAMTLAEAKKAGYTLCGKCYAAVSAASTKAAPAQTANPAPAAAAAAAAPASVTPEQAVQQAYTMYMQSGMDSNTAFARVQAKIADFTAAPANYAAIVQSDLASLSGATAAITAEQAVAQAYNIYMQRGLDSATAFAKVQALVPQIAAAPSNYAQIVAAN